MHIFVDEAGPFVLPRIGKWSVSCIGALVIRDIDVDSAFAGFEQIKNGWGLDGAEIKGSKLDEQQVAQLIDLLSGYDMIFEVTAIDMAAQTPYGITKHRLKQADKFVEKLTDKYHENVRKALHNLRKQLRELSNQLYIQTVCSVDLLYRTLQKATLYYVQRYPEELAEFHWVIDAKDKNITPYEEMWQKIILPALQSESFSNPFIQLIGADYDNFLKYCKQSPEPPNYLKDVVGDKKPFKYIEINEIYQKHLAFEQSKKNLGLQIVDILTTNIRRAMNGNLQYNGWLKFGRLMVQSNRNSQVIQIIDLSGRRMPTYLGKKPPYCLVIPHVGRTCKRMLMKVA